MTKGLDTIRPVLRAGRIQGSDDWVLELDCGHVVQHTGSPIPGAARCAWCKAGAPVPRLRDHRVTFGEPIEVRYDD